MEIRKIEFHRQIAHHFFYGIIYGTRVIREKRSTKSIPLVKIFSCIRNIRPLYSRLTFFQKIPKIEPTLFLARRIFLSRDLRPSPKKEKGRDRVRSAKGLNPRRRGDNVSGWKVKESGFAGCTSLRKRHRGRRPSSSR